MFVTNKAQEYLRTVSNMSLNNKKWFCDINFSAKLVISCVYHKHKSNYYV